MHRIIEFVIRFKNYITLVALCVMSLSFMSIGELSRLGGFRAVIVGGIGWMQSVFAWIPNPVALKAENAALRELNVQLSAEAARARLAMAENATLRRMLDLSQQVDYDLITADIVGKVTTQLRNYATLSRGSDHGIVEGMSVVTDAGLAGHVVGVSSRYSVVQLLLNRDTRIAARLYNSAVEGILTWEGEDLLALKYVPKTVDVELGDYVITSLFSVQFPPNVILGYVSKIAEDPNNALFQRIMISPAVNFNTLEQVFVIRQIPESERKLLERTTLDSLSGRHGR